MSFLGKKRSKKFWFHAKWAMVGAALGDIAFLGAGYYYYQQMKNSSDFRQKVYNYDQRFLDMYYRANEKYGDGTARQNDYKEWGIKGVKSFEFVHHIGL